MAKVVLSVGTKKGLFLLESDSARESWKEHGPFLKGDDINHATVDVRTSTVFATANSPWFGNRVARSQDMGSTWQDTALARSFLMAATSLSRSSGAFSRPTTRSRVSCTVAATQPAYFAPKTTATPGSKTPPLPTTRREAAGRRERVA